MTVSVVPVGNSRGIRLPKNLITELNIGRTLQLERQGDSIILTPVHEKPRENWEAAFASMHETGGDALLVPDVFADENSDWEW
jgi:antitoxin MazE